MNRNFFNIYQYIAFIVIFPLTLFIWYKEFSNIKFAFLFLSLPILTAYIIPAIGTNVTRLWEFNTRFMIGKFRIYHGFVLGSVTSLFGFMFYKISPNYNGIINSLIFATICGAFIAFWNWIYDIFAVKCGFIIINNKSAYEKKSAHEIVFDYAPVYFYAFGFIYSLYIKYLEYSISTNNLLNIFLIYFHIASLTIPPILYAFSSKIKYGIFEIGKYIPLEEKH